MKFKALRRSLVRLFGRPATQGRGEIVRTPPREGFRPNGVTLTFDAFIDPIKVRIGATSQHPLSPEADPPPIDWKTWCEYSNEHRRDGWAFCRYPIRSPPPDNLITFVFGMVRGHFGVHGIPMVLGAPIHQEAPTFHITHLRGGFGCGVFMSMDQACTAAEIASRLAVDWDAFDPDADDRAPLAVTLGRAHLAWVNAGLIPAPFLAHRPGRPDIQPLNVWFQDFTPTERPEKPS